MTTGKICRIYGLYSTVLAEDRLYTCTKRKKLAHHERGKANLLTVGDEVSLTLSGEDTAVIEAVMPRRTRLSRFAAGRRSEVEHILVANVDQVMCVQATARPEPNPGFLDRLIVAAEMAGIRPIIIFNKIDLAPEAVAEFCKGYTAVGYQVLTTSAATGIGMEALRAKLVGKVSAFIGLSGVGKTSLLQHFLPDYVSRTAEVIDRSGRGRHTTTFSELLPLPEGGAVADTPGLREFGVWNLDAGDLGDYFPEIAARAGECRFTGCTHTQEPGCAVKGAEEILPWRYQSYLNIFQDLKGGR